MAAFCVSVRNQAGEIISDIPHGTGEQGKGSDQFSPTVTLGHAQHRFSSWNKRGKKSKLEFDFTK